MPKRSTARRVIIGSLFVLTVVGISACSSGPPPEAIYRALQPQDSSLFNGDGTPRFDILKVERPQSGWYIASIKLRDVDTEIATVILKDADSSGDNLTVVEGPGTDFPRPEPPTPDPLPSSIRSALGASGHL